MLKLNESKHRMLLMFMLRQISVDYGLSHLFTEYSKCRFRYDYETTVSICQSHHALAAPV